VKLGEEEYKRYKKIQQENVKLKDEVRKLRKILQHANLDNKMDPDKKEARNLRREKEAINNKDICPHCKSQLSRVRIPRQNKTLLLCKQCPHREFISDLDQSD